MSNVLTAVRSGSTNYKFMWRNGGIDTDCNSNDFEEEDHI